MRYKGYSFTVHSSYKKEIITLFDKDTNHIKTKELDFEVDLNELESWLDVLISELRIKVQIYEGID